MNGLQQRSIIHVDMDAFYASVEQRDDPTLADRPVIVGGLGNRGVVSAANYAARRFGVHSAMPIARARRLCPQAVYRRPRMGVYRAVSRQVFAVFERFTPLVQGLSLDEAFLDVTGSERLFGSIASIGRQLKRAIQEDTGLVASVGMAPNKFLAKLASDFDKPDGYCLVTVDRITAFLDPIPIGRLWGIGRKTEPRLRQAGILTIGDLRRASPSLAEELLGRRAGHFQALARGEDERPVESLREDKSISHESTFSEDLRQIGEMRAVLQSQAVKVGARLRRKQLCARTITIKIRHTGFRTDTRSRSLPAYTQSSDTIYAVARNLLRVWLREHRNTPVRLLGVGVSQLAPAADPGELMEGRSARLDRLRDAIDGKFGEAALASGLQLRYRDRE